MITHQLDHAGVALSKLLDQFKSKPDLEAFLRAFIQDHQDVEDVFWQLYTERTIDNAVGVQLDVIGRIVDQPRGSSTDDTDYRKRLKARVRVLRSSGTPDDIGAVFFALLGDWTFFKFVPSYPAGFDFPIFKTITEVDAQLYTSFLFKAKAAGVYGNLFYQLVLDADSFMCSPSVCWADGDVSAGDASISAFLFTSEVPFGMWPPSGVFVVDRGTSSQELLNYSSIGGGGYYLSCDTFAFDHTGLFTIELYTDAGLGFGDTSDNAIGGGLAGVKEV